jgi:hypothetical protein
LEPTVSGGDDIVGVCSPDEGFCVVDIVFGDEAVDGGLQVDQTPEYAMLEPPPGQLGEEAFDGVQPGRRCRCEVEGPARVAGQPGPDLVLLVRRVVVEDHVDSLFLRHFALDTIEEADIGGRGMGMP